MRRAGKLSGKNSRYTLFRPSKSASSARKMLTRTTFSKDEPASSSTWRRLSRSYVRKLVTELSGGVFGYLDSVLERHSFDEFGELI